VLNGDCQQTCRNTDGSYVCGCRQGFSLREDLHTCKDVDECLDNPCFSGQLCTNTYGGFYCLNVGGGSSGLTDNSELLAEGISPVTIGTVVGTLALTALVSILLAVGVILAVRRIHAHKSDTANC
jgi:hypothetical protein